MTNPFSGIITPAMKDLFNNALDALFDTDGLTLPCKLIYEGTKYEDCTNCIDNPYSPGGSVYSHGQGIPFRHGQTCPNCGGSGKVLIENFDTLYLAVIWNYQQFINKPPNYVQGSVETLSILSTTIDKIKQANEIIIDTNIEPYQAHRFIRSGEPTPCGLGSSRYITTLWIPAA